MGENNYDPFYSSKQFQDFFKNSASSLVMRANVPDFTILAASDNYLKITYKQRNQLLGKNLFEVFPGSQSDPSEKNSVHSSFLRVIETKATDELPVFKYEIYVEESNSYITEYWTNKNEPLLDEQGNVIYIINTTTNITQQILQQHALEESENRFRLMADGTDVMIAVGDETGAATYFNQAWIEATGRTADDLMRYGWADLMHPNDKDRVLGIFTNAFSKREPWTWEFRMPDKIGGYKWLLARGIPRFRTDGSFAGYISSCVDITYIKQEEQRKNDFINMVSHELKTPLTSTLSYVQIAQRKVAQNNDDFTADILERTSKQLGKMTAIINGFLNVSRLESGQIHINLQEFDLAVLIKETEEESIASISSHQVLFASVEETWVTADRDKIGQVINNLIRNAVKYSPTGSTINVACQTVNGLAMVSVRDEGIGIKQEDMPKLFDRYFRAKDMSSVSGFGIGLYLCKEIINRHEGKIWAESVPGEGSTFWFSISTRSQQNKHKQEVIDNPFSISIK